MKIGTDSFRGEAPRVTRRALPDNGAFDATNARLLTGDVNAWGQFALTKALTETAPVRSIALMAGQFWLSFQTDVDIARGIIPGDTTFRTYLTGPDEFDQPRFTNLAMATTGSEPFPVTTRPLGVPAPETTPTVAVGIDPNPSTFQVDILDEGDSLATNWTTSPFQGASGFTSVVQSAIFGHPTPSYEIEYDQNGGFPAFLYRNFGVSQLNAVQMSFDFLASNIGNSNPHIQLVAGIARNVTGQGICVSVDSLGGLSIGHATVNWGTIGVSNLTTVPISLASETWYTCTISLIKNADFTQTVTATIYNGSVQLATSTTTNTFEIGDFCGFAAETGEVAGGSHYFSYYDNILVQGGGSTGYNPTNTATSYLYTFVNDLGEESAPSFASSTVLRPDGVSVTVTTPEDVPTGISADYFITTKRIYRAATGATGTIFRFVAEIPLSQADYVDVIPDTELGEALPSEGWDLPPDDMRGILALPNGVMVGFRRNQLCLSAQNHPHAWPLAYRLNTDTDIVGIGNIDTTVVIGTKSYPYLAGGNDPAAYSMSKLEMPQACVSKRSFASLAGIGVAFASPDGLIAIAGTGQIRNLTDTVFTREQWQALQPATIMASAHDDVYHFWYDNDSVGAASIGWFNDILDSGSFADPSITGGSSSNAAPGPYYLGVGSYTSGTVVWTVSWVPVYPDDTAPVFTQDDPTTGDASLFMSFTIEPDVFEYSKGVLTLTATLDGNECLGTLTFTIAPGGLYGSVDWERIG